MKHFVIITDQPKGTLELPLQTIRVARGELLTVFFLAFVVVVILVVSTWKSRAEVIRAKKGIFQRRKPYAPLANVVIDSEGTMTVTNNDQKGSKLH